MPPCWHYLAPRFPTLAGPGVIIIDDGRRRPNDRSRDRSRITSPTSPTYCNSSGVDRMQGEDLRSWLLTYELNLDVYICANKFLADDFKLAISRSCVDMLEPVGANAAQPQVLQLCSKIYERLPESDVLRRMIFARVGLLQPILWRLAPQETSEFLLGHFEISALILIETPNMYEQDVNQPLLGQLYLPPLPPLDSPYARHRAHLHRARW